MTGHPFPELDDERTHLAFARMSRDRMIERLEAVDPEGAADEITKEYVEVTVADALDDLRTPGTGEFFGRIDVGATTDGHDRAIDIQRHADRWYIGRRHIEDGDHNPVIIDWRAPVAAPFYRATAADPLDVTLRRRFTLDHGDITAYLDEHLDDPDSDTGGGGIPDPVLAEIGAAREGEMREIVATIQAEQDIIIRSPVDQALIVQGGPGTGKTAVALHRAAYLLFEHRRRLQRDGVLVIGPNTAFLDYIGNVLPSLGERSVRQCTVLDLCVPKVEVTGVDDPGTSRWKGAAERLGDLAERSLAAVTPPDGDVIVRVGARKVTFERDRIAGWLETVSDGILPINQRRERLHAIAKRELLRETGLDEAWSKADELKKALNRAWPTQKPITLVDRFLPGPRGKKRVWTAADQLLVDEANSLLNGPPFTYGHVVVDEAQDHSAVALRVIGRRSPSRSLTLVGDVAQSTTSGGQERWQDVFAHLGAEGMVAGLTIGYRVPEPILSVANRLLPLTGVDATASESVRRTGVAPQWLRASSQAGVATAVAEAVGEMKRHHRLVGVVAPAGEHDPISDALAVDGRQVVDHVHELADDEIPLFTPEAVKGLEFDGVIVANPHEILDGTNRGARLLYVAMTRAVQQLTFVSAAPLPDVLAGSTTPHHHRVGRSV